jgi:hypothetical protein
MNTFLIILKFIASFIAISSTLLYLGNYINSVDMAKALFTDKDSTDLAKASASYRIKLGLIMAVSWSIVIAI